MTKQQEIEHFRNHLGMSMEANHRNCIDFDELICYELHSQPINPRMMKKTANNGFMTGLTFRELAEKWGISTAFLGEIIDDHCKNWS